MVLKEEADEHYLTEEQKAMLEERLQEDQTTYLTEKEFIDQLDKKYGL